MSAKPIHLAVAISMSLILHSMAFVIPQLVAKVDGGPGAGTKKTTQTLPARLSVASLPDDGGPGAVTVVKNELSGRPSANDKAITNVGFVPPSKPQSAPDIPRIESGTVFYPTNAQLSGVEGTVVLFVVFSPNGTPSEIIVSSSSGNQELDSSAVTAMGKLSDKSLANSAVSIPVRFSLK